MKSKSKSIGNSEKRKRQKTARVENETPENLKAEVLDIQGLREGMVLLGCVTEIRSNCLLVSLPGCLVGKVSLGNISSKYTETIMQSGEEEAQAADLSTIVEVGAMYPCKVMEVTYKEKLKKPLILLSMDPQVVNSELRVQSLYLKMVLHAAVQSVEDHGYILDVGVPSVQGFLPFSGCSGVRTLVLGQIIPVCVRKLPSHKKGNVVWLSKISHNETFAEIDDDNMKLTSILPGANVTAYITEVKQPFIYMKCMSFDACANMMSLGSSNQNLTETAKVTGTVLYVHPLSHMIYLHLGPKPTPDSFQNFFRLKKYDLVKNVKYLYFWHHRLILKMNKGALGFVKKGELPDKGNISKDSLGRNPVIPKGRVVYLHYMDNLVQLSLNESTINMEIIKPEEVQIGDIYEATVTKHIESGMFVTICPGFSGFVRSIHLSDALVTMPEKLYPVGAKVKCRVLSQHDSVSFNLSSKESFLCIPPTDLLLSYEQVQKGHFYKGVIVQKTNLHLLVLFFNDIKGVVPSEEIPESSVLFVGQTVSCRVLQCDPSKQRLKLSLIGDTNASKSSDKISKLPKMDLEAALAEGKFDPRKKQRAIIQSITDQQLKIVLDGGLRGRVHITEIGNAEEGSLPLKNFKSFQRIAVHVLGSYDRKGVNYLEISHRRTETFLECSLQFPPPAPLQREHLPGMDVTGYVREASNTSCTLWISPVQTATLDYLHISENPKELRKLKKQLKIGLAVNAQVLKVEKKSKDSYHVTLTKLDTDFAVSSGRNVVGLVQIACPEKGLVVRLPHGYHGRASLCDLQDALPSLTLAPTLDKCRRMLYVLCHVLEVNRDTKFCTLSLRKTRLYGQKSNESKDTLPELTASTLERGVCAKGFVKMTYNDSLVVNFGRLLDGQVTLHRCNAYGCTFCAHSKEVLQKHPPGGVIEVVVDGTTPSKGLYPLSLPEMEGMGLSQQSRLTVTDDIDWDET